MNDLVHRLAAVLLGAALLAHAGCEQSTGAAAPKFEITSVGWYEENIDPSYWASPLPDGQTAFYDFFVHYEGDVTFADFESVRMQTPKGFYWNLLVDETFLDTTNKVIGGWRRWPSGSPHRLPIGDLWVEVRLTDGRVVTATRNVPAPGSSITGAFTSMHTEDLLSPPADSAPMVRRATVAEGTLDAAAQTLSFTFTVDDGLVHNGWVGVFDATGTYLGSSSPFRDVTTGAVSGVLGGLLNTDGTPNEVTLHAADLQLASGAAFSEIAKVRVALVDGRQYAYPAYDCVSLSGAAVVTAH